VSTSTVCPENLGTGFLREDKFPAILIERVGPSAEAVEAFEIFLSDCHTWPECTGRARPSSPS
jgi:hypothetical protein